jgi:hypothetical protein
MYIVQDQPLPLSETLLLPPLESLLITFTRFIREIRSCLSRGILDLATIATYIVQTDDEEYGGLGGKHSQGYE